MFAVTHINSENFIAYLKCDPERSIELRDTYPESITDEGRK
ncbi:MAG: putative DNA-binding protein (MmcQ/YjbR family) [Paraglaciecola sp.]|jgi:predicted DNA-binding protein (MmcQ/YjbR family)